MSTDISTAEETALRAEVDKRKVELARLEKGLYGVKVRNRRYVVDVDWPYQQLLNYPNPDTTFIADNAADAPYGMASAPFITDQNTRFYVKQVSFALLAIGTLSNAIGATPTAANVAVPAVLRAIGNYGNTYGAVNFRWKIRSTGNDRDWQNQFLPDWLLQSGSRNGLRFRRAQYCLVGGSETTVTIAPVRVDLVRTIAPGVVDTGLTSISALRFQFVFGGVEVEG